MSGVALNELFVALGVNVDRAQFDAADRVIARLEGSFDGIKEAFARIPEQVKNIALGTLLAGAVEEGISAVKATVSEIPRQIEDAIVRTAEAGNEMNKLAIATGVSAQSLQEFKYVAAQTEVPFEAIRMGIFHIQRTAFEASKGNGELAQTFARLGVQVKDASGHVRPAEELFIDTADALGKMKDQSTANGISFQLFGRGATELVPLLRESRESIAQMRAEAHEFGIVMDATLIQQGVEWDNAVDRMEASFEGLRYAVGGDLIHYLTKGANALADWVKVNRDWIATDLGAFVDGVADVIRAFIPDAKTASGAVMGLGAAVRVVGYALTLLSYPLSLLVTLLKWGAVAAGLYTVGLLTSAAAELLVAAGGISLEVVIWKIIVALGYVNTELIVATGGFILLGAAVTAVLAALLLLADDLYVYSKGGKSLFGDFVNLMGQIRDQIQNGGGDQVPWFLRVLFTAYETVRNIADLFDDIFHGRMAPALARLGAVSMLANPATAYWAPDVIGYADRLEPSSRFGSGSAPGAPSSLAFQGPYENPYAASLSGGGVVVHAPTTIVVQGGGDAKAIAEQLEKHLDARDEKMLRAARAALVNPGVEQ